MKKLTFARFTCIMFTLCAATVLTSQAQTFATVFSFNGTDGSTPYYGTLVQDAAGNLYGTTDIGGSSSSCGGCGTVFELTPTGTLTTLYNFCSLANCADGDRPLFGLVLGKDGNFYGTTSQGGVNGGYGTIFQLTPAGVFTTLHSFDGVDGATPTQLIEATNGDFYGTTEAGGNVANCNNPFGCGTVFAFTASGAFRTLYNFCSQLNCTDGTNPRAGLVQARSGRFYGTTNSGGAINSGTVFSMTGAGSLTTLYSFCVLSKCPDGYYPQAPLIQGANGSFYGTTTYGGKNSGNGTVFKITAAGALTTLRTFNGNDGAQPLAGVVQDSSGSLYGTTSLGGAKGNGVVFKLAPGGVLSVLHFFSGSDGALPYAGLLLSSGLLYGTTGVDGPMGAGTVFSITP